MEQKLFTESFFSKNQFFKKELNLTNEKIDEIRKNIQNWQIQCKTFTKGIDKETGDSGEFIRIVFREVLGYSGKGENSQNYNYESEFPIEGGGNSGKKGFADLALGLFTKKGRNPQVLVEFKDQSSNDLEKRSGRKDGLSPVDQCWKYMNNTPSSSWGIVTNYNEIRLYNKGLGQNRYEVFYFVVPEEFKEKYKPLSDEKELYKFITLLRKENLISESGKPITQEILELQGKEEEKVQDDFYKQYKSLRAEIFYTLLEYNTEYQSQESEKPFSRLYSKTRLLQLVQKFLDRIIFCWFCEDSRERLIPNNVLSSEIIEKETKDKFYNSKGFSIYGKIRDLFYAIDTGHGYGIEEGYNGELFKEDEELDKLKIPNFIFEKISEIGLHYDFGNENEVNVNILGHIFEQSISDLEEMRVSFQELDQGAKPLETQKTLEFGDKELEKLEHKTISAEYDKKKSKRKKDGVFYTPEYITRYIVENTVGEWLKEKYKECEKMHSAKKRNKEYTILMEYRENYLSKIKILDPACGSGAFLNATFDYLWKEHLRVASAIKELKSKSAQGFLLDLYSVSKTILEKNLYGVDLNRESVEITKLSLWLKTAAINKKLNNLEANIKWGNSLIDDKNVAGELAFNWGNEFPEIIYPEKIQYKDYYDYDLKNKRMPVFKAYSKNKESPVEEKISGFDIIIGNPPWGAHLNKKEKEYLKLYKINDESLNSAYLFIGRSNELLNRDGYLGFIVPKGLTYVPNLINVRNFIRQSFNVLEILDTSESFHKSGVDLEAIILLLNYKNNGNKVYTGYFEGNKLNKNKINYSLVIKDEKYGVWINEKNKYIISKVQNKSIRLGDLCTSKRGININKYVSNKKASNIVIGGAPIFRYYIDYLTYADKKYITDSFSWQMKQKIMLQEIVGRVGKPLFGNYRKIVLNATLDKEGKNYTLDTVVNLYDFNSEYSIEYVLAILNSKLISYYFHIYNCAFSQITLHSGNENARSIPIRKLIRRQQQVFVKNTNILLSHSKSLRVLKYGFLELLQTDFHILNISTKSKLNQWYLLEWKEFVKKLENKKIKMTDELEEKWFGRFKRKKEEALAIKETIDKTDAEIDLMVYKLYELTHDEVKIVDPEFGMSKKEYNAYEIPES